MAPAAVAVLLPNEIDAVNAESLAEPRDPSLPVIHG